jgi:hypothetical protein
LGKRGKNITSFHSRKPEEQEEINLKNFGEATAMAKCQKTLVHFCNDQTTFRDSWSCEHVSFSHTYKLAMHKEKIPLLIFMLKTEYDIIYSF